MRHRPYLILTVSTAIAVAALLFAAACQDVAQWIDPDTQHFDAAVDYVLAPQASHIGPSSVVCCLEPLGNAATFYLANPMPAGFDRNGEPKPPQGTLHLATPYGIDYTLGDKVPAFGYTFSPDGKTAFFLQLQSDTFFSMNAIRIELPNLPEPNPKTVIADGLSDDPLTAQGFFTPSGSYFIAFARAPGVQNTPDMHIVSVLGGKDLFTLGHGSGAGAENITSGDTLIFTTDTASTTPGVPSRSGLYMANLNAVISGAPPVLIDDLPTTFPQLTADESTLVYQRINGDLMLWDLRDQDRTQLAANVVTFSIGPTRRGPIVWVQKDLSMHVAKQQQPEEVTLPAGSISLQSPIVFSPDRQHLYFFKNYFVGSSYGDLYHVELPPTGTGKPNLVSVRASSNDFHFAGEKLLYINNVSNTGDTGDLIISDFDGSHPQLQANGVVTGDLNLAFPQPYMPPPGQTAGFYPHGTPDMTVLQVPAVMANLVNAARDTTSGLQFVTSTRPVLGELAYAPALGKPEIALNQRVHAGQYQFSDDGYVLMYVGDVQYQKSAFNYVGSMQMSQTNNNVNPIVPMLDGVAEIGPIVGRGAFVLAPGNATPGLYFVKY